jgi:hypothetical protein
VLNLAGYLYKAASKFKAGGRKRLSMIQMVLLTHLKAGFGVTAVASQVTDDGLPAVFLNFGAPVSPPNAAASFTRKKLQITHASGATLITFLLRKLHLCHPNGTDSRSSLARGHSGT